MKPGFKELQREWYAKLAASGFVDIERDEEAKKGSRWANLLKPDIEVSNHFAAISHAYEQTFGHLHPRLLTHRQRVMMYVLGRHSDGASTRCICRELQNMDLRPNRRNTLNSWIKQFVHACGIRHYEVDEMRNP